MVSMDIRTYMRCFGAVGKAGSDRVYRDDGRLFSHSGSGNGHKAADWKALSFGQSNPIRGYDIIGDLGCL
jgi:hypothetical protein